MKRILFAGAFLLSSLSFYACDRHTDDEHTTESENVVVDRDSVATEYEVTETVVDYDTTTRTKTVDVDHDDKDDDN